ncbi:hypothetical protein M407DRAFT_31053 [Tulasnella calospora MUT 4182]|uniref:Uncharacterized protein n=1 Tax=Tulasnella calospora MUT 4182 TaxID=1051891 RepID=A0A0C3KCV5_9AGAM|nr:hypothetical protein M407DRAFT_31053 [Tulasnella calospora MUT 4182]
MAENIARQLEADPSAAKSLLDELQSHQAFGRLAPIIPQLPQPAMQVLLAFDSVQRLVAEDPAFSNEFLIEVLQNDASLVSKKFIQYLPPERAATLLSHICSDLLVAFEFIGPLKLPIDVENGILAEFELRLPGTPAADAPEEPERDPTDAEGPATAAAAVPAQVTILNSSTTQSEPSQLSKPAPTRSPHVLPGPSSRAVPAPEVGMVARPDEAIATSRPKRQMTAHRKLAPIMSDSEDDVPSSSGDEESDLYVPPPPKSPDHAAPADAPGTSAARPRSPVPAPAAAASASRTVQQGRRRSPVPAPEPAASSSGTVQEGSSIYGDVAIPSPEEHRKRWESKMDAAMWDLMHNSSIAFQDKDSDPEKWPSILKKYRAKHSDQAELPPVLDDETRVARESQWGDQHDDIIAFEKQQFLALPSVIRKCAGRANSSRNNGDIYLSRFWAPYLMVNVCILDDKDSITRANAEIIEYTFRRFSHLADPNSTTEGQASAAYKTPICNCLSTYKNRVARTFTRTPAEPKVKKRQMERALSFVAGELRRSGIANLWALEDRQKAVNEQVADRMAAFAEELKVDVSHPDVQAQRLGFRSTASAVLFRQQPEEVRREYEGKAQDPSMSSADFADASGPMLRSFADALADETDGVGLVVYALRTSQGPLVMVSQHGEKLKDRSWLQSKGTDFLKPFFEVASSIFEVDEGQLGVVTAQAAVPAESVDHPWTRSKPSLLSAPKFQVPVTDTNEQYNAKLLRQVILDAIRTYSGESPPFAKLRANVDKYIVPGTSPTFLVEPIHMGPIMLQRWIDHWLQSADPDSDLPPEKRLRFTGQTLWEEAPLLYNMEEDDPDADDEMYEPPCDVKAPAKKTPASSSKGAPKPKAPAKPKGKGKEKEVPSAQPQGKRKGKEKEVQSVQPVQRRPRPTREVFVEIPALKHTRQPNTRGNAQQSRASQHPSPAAKAVEDRAVAPHSPAEPTGWPLDVDEPSAAGPSGPRGGTPTPFATQIIFSPQQPDHSDQDAPRTPQTPLSRIPSPIPMQIDSPEGLPAPPVMPHSATPVAADHIALVQYSSDHESSLQLPTHPAAHSRGDPAAKTSSPDDSPDVVSP